MALIYAHGEVDDLISYRNTKFAFMFVKLRVVDGKLCLFVPLIYKSHNH